MLGRRITLFELFGFRINVDASWLVLAVLVVWGLATGYFPAVAPGYGSATYAWMGIAGLIGLGASIIVHELAHALVARRYEMRIESITLFIFGGVAEMREEPSSPKGEALMALAGPAMSLAAGLVFAGLGGVAAGSTIVEGHLAPPAIVAAYLALINFLLAGFNLVPAFPLDGGRVLRAVLWGWKGDILWATRIAAASGKGFALALALLGLYMVVTGNLVAGLWWVLISFFVRLAADAALSQQTARAAFAGLPVTRFMERSPIVVDSDLPLDRLVDEYFYRYYLRTFPVTENGRLVGFVSLDSLDGTDPGSRRLDEVNSVMERCTADSFIPADADVGRALAQLRRSGQRHLMVIGDGRLLGIVSLNRLQGRHPANDAANDRRGGRIGTA